MSGVRGRDRQWIRPTVGRLRTSSGTISELLARGRANTWNEAFRERLHPEAWPDLRPTFEVPSGATIFTIGSCFAREIEENLQRLGYEIPTLKYHAPRAEIGAGRPSYPFNKYTPSDILQELEWAAAIYERDARPRKADSVAFAYPTADGKVKDLALAGSRPVTPARFHERRRTLYERWEQVFSADCVVITFGLTEAWLDRTTGKALVDPPFFPLNPGDENRFDFRTLDYETCRSQAQCSLDLVRRHNPAARFLLTTSPVPMNQSFSDDDILIANSLSKSTLRTVCGALVRDNVGVDYFPSYESVTSTRSWDVWDHQGHAVAPAFVAKIVARLAENYFAAAGRPRVLTQLAFAELGAGRSDEALTLARQACELNAEIADAWLARAEANKRLGLRQEAIECSRQAVALAEHSAEAHRNLIHLLLEAGSSDGLEQLCNRVVSIDPEDPRNLLVQGLARERLNDLQGAEVGHRRALELQPETPTYHFALVGILRKLGRLEEALQRQRAAIERFPSLITQRLDLVQTLKAEGRFDEAGEVITEGLRRGPDEDDKRKLNRALEEIAAAR